MSDRAKNSFLLTISVFTALITIAVQIGSLGELKGTIMGLLQRHTEEIVQLSASDKAQDKDIAEIKGKLHGLASQVEKVPGNVAAKLNNDEEAKP